MAPRETENNAYAKFGVTNKEHYGMLWYFLEWSILVRNVTCHIGFTVVGRILYKSLLAFWSAGQRQKPGDSSGIRNRCCL